MCCKLQATATSHVVCVDVAIAKGRVLESGVRLLLGMHVLIKKMLATCMCALNHGTISLNPIIRAQ